MKSSKVGWLLVLSLILIVVSMVSQKSTHAAPDTEKAPKINFTEDYATIMVPYSDIDPKKSGKERMKILLERFEEQIKELKKSKMELAPPQIKKDDDPLKKEAKAEIVPLEKRSKG